MSFLGAVQQQAASAVAATVAGNITVVGSSTSVLRSNNNAPLTIGLNSVAYQAGNVAAMYVVADGGNGPSELTIVDPTGWIPVFDDYFVLSGGRSMRNALYLKVLGATEADPQVENATNEQYSVSLKVYAGVDTTNILDVPYSPSHSSIVTNDSTPVPPPITTATDNAMILLFCGVENVEVTQFVQPASPAGIVLGPVQLGNSHIRHAHAQLLNAGPAGLKTFSEWANVNSGDKDSQCHTVALRAA